MKLSTLNFLTLFFLGPAITGLTLQFFAAGNLAPTGIGTTIGLSYAIVIVFFPLLFSLCVYSLLQAAASNKLNLSFKNHVFFLGVSNVLVSVLIALLVYTISFYVFFPKEAMLREQPFLSVIFVVFWPAVFCGLLTFRLSIAYNKSKVKRITSDKMPLIDFLIQRAGIDIDIRSLKVESLDDGGMGSLRFSTASDSSHFGEGVAQTKFKDIDGVEVSATLYLDQDGELFELDMFKSDFSKLKKWPDENSLMLVD